MSDISLGGVFVKIERAKKHLRDLDAQARAFFALDPYRLVTEDAGSDDTVLLVRVLQEVPLEVRATIGDVVHNLRSAFDHLAWQLVIAGGGRPGRHTGFPVFARSQDFESDGRDRLTGMWEGAVRVIESLQPYTQGDMAEAHPLYLIHHLDRRDKHQLLTVVGAAISDFGVGMVDPSRRVFIIDRLEVTTGKSTIPLRDRTELARGSRHNFNMQIQVRFQLAFDKRGPGRGQPVLPLLDLLIRFTELAIPQFDICFC